jgi:hypothetical protein
MDRIIGIVLIVIGLVGVAYGGITWTRQSKVAEVGSLHLTYDKTESLPIPPIAGAVCLVAGAVILTRGGRRA